MNRRSFFKSLVGGIAGIAGLQVLPKAEPLTPDVVNIPTDRAGAKLLGMNTAQIFVEFTDGITYTAKGTIETLKVEVFDQEMTQPGDAIRHFKPLEPLQGQIDLSMTFEGDEATKWGSQ